MMDEQLVARAPRFPSHALIDLRTNRWNPFSKRSAVLLDMSVSGFKIQLVDKAVLKMNSMCYLDVPLEPFGILSGQRLVVRAQVKWFDPEGLRAGGVFVGTSDNERLLIERVIAAVISRESGL
jgi:hypothetical protein